MKAMHSSLNPRRLTTSVIVKLWCVLNNALRLSALLVQIKLCGRSGDL